MVFPIRFALWCAAAFLALLADVVTKAEPHHHVVNHYAQTPLPLLVGVSLFLLAVGLLHSRILAVGTGLMFGALWGNGGQLVLYGYASDWIPVAGWLTNVADIAGALGLLCCLAGYAAPHRLYVRRRGAENIR